jgi:hypothetical protein
VKSAKTIGAQIIPVGGPYYKYKEICKVALKYQNLIAEGIQGREKGLCYLPGCPQLTQVLLLITDSIKK